MSTLDPGNSRRRDRSTSGRERSRSRGRYDDDEPPRGERERSRVRAPSPPSSRYEYEETIERVEKRPSVVTAEPRGSHGSLGQYRDRDESPPSRGVGRGGRGSDYDIPGAFKEEETKIRYEGSSGRGGREKDYYLEKKTKVEVDQWGRPTSPPPEHRSSRYEIDIEKEKGRGRYSPEKHSRYEIDIEKEKEKGRYSPERRSKYEIEIEKEKRRHSPERHSKYEIEIEKEKGRHSDRYEVDIEKDKYKYSSPTDARRYEEERDSHGRERGASFNISAGSHSVSGGINVGHGQQPGFQPPYPGAPPSGYQPPYPGEPPLGDGRHYAEPPKWEYAEPDEKITYTKRQEVTTYNTRTASPPGSQYTASSSKYRHGSYPTGPDSTRLSESKVVTVEPGSRRRDASPNPGLAPRMHSLSVSTGRHGSSTLSLANAPGSPLLEAYHGTYQSISPMPSPLMIASHAHSDINLMEPLSPESSGDERRGGKKRNRTARFHDPVEEATILAKALKGEKRAPDTAPLIEILPGLTHEQVLDLRVEYKKIVKTGSEKKGVNIAKHIKLRLKEEDPSLMKACYACALGKWESEAYWANFWYQGEKSRRELLIESLMGRTNREIRQIKDGFSDKKYSDSLVKCMKTELKEDKFKKAILLVLDEDRMEERPGERVDMRLVEDDVRDLHKAVKSEKGGETAMISIVVVRSDGHMREVLRLYESTYRANFAREMLKKSGNLVVCSSHPQSHPPLFSPQLI
jgi:hypothetical protein